MFRPILSPSTPTIALDSHQLPVEREVVWASCMTGEKIVKYSGRVLVCRVKLRVRGRFRPVSAWFTFESGQCSAFRSSKQLMARLGLGPGSGKADRHAVIISDKLKLFAGTWFYPTTLTISNGFVVCGDFEKLSALKDFVADFSSAGCTRTSIIL